MVTSATRIELELTAGVEPGAKGLMGGRRQLKPEVQNVGIKGLSRDWLVRQRTFPPCHSLALLLPRLLSRPEFMDTSAKGSGSRACFCMSLSNCHVCDAFRPLTCAFDEAFACELAVPHAWWWPKGREEADCSKGKRGKNHKASQLTPRSNLLCISQGGSEENRGSTSKNSLHFCDLLTLLKGMQILSWKVCLSDRSQAYYPLHRIGVSSGYMTNQKKEKRLLVLAQGGASLSREGELPIGYTQGSWVVHEFLERNESIIMAEMTSYLSRGM
ncbi:hypothetical protein VNO77_34129 [Canavalia gladiata]|uniref:Uncharacterized protein n=1 Tax=Canavalia gladiata TaxID=3824 RepID=A0AAN9Q1H4_CANGL